MSIWDKAKKVASRDPADLWRDVRHGVGKRVQGSDIVKRGQGLVHRGRGVASTAASHVRTAQSMAQLYGGLFGGAEAAAEPAAPVLEHETVHEDSPTEAPLPPGVGKPPTPMSHAELEELLE